MASKSKQPLVLFKWQEEAVQNLRSGSVLVGRVGSGKTLTSLVFYKRHYNHIPLYIATTAMKRDSGDWEKEAKLAGIDDKDVHIDSWNNISKIKDLSGKFIIFDEQKASGYGLWARTFIKLARKNYWILLTATPGDTWMDYVPIFCANNFFRNKTHFENEHVEFDRFAKYPKIKKYHNVGKLEYYRRSVIVTMDSPIEHTRKRIYQMLSFNKDNYEFVKTHRLNIYKDNEPIQTPSEFTQVLRRIVCESRDRELALISLTSKHDKIVLFYNYDYELEAIKKALKMHHVPYFERNGHKHDPIPDQDQWAYLVQYNSGAEAWNCISTNQMIFYSMSYSYKQMEQAEGRIDRLNSPFNTMYYYIFQTASPIDRAIANTVKRKKIFNEKIWAKDEGYVRE